MELKLSLKSDKPALTEYNDTANSVVSSIDLLGKIISNTFNPKLFITIEHNKNHQAYNYIYTIHIHDDAQDTIILKERHAIIGILFENLKIIAEKPVYEELCDEWIDKLHIALTNSHFAVDEEGIEEISSVLGKLRKNLSRIYSKLKIEMHFDYINKGRTSNQISENNIGLFDQPNVPSENDNTQQKDKLSETQRYPSEGTDSTESDKNGRAEQSDQTTDEDTVDVELIARTHNSGRLHLITYIDRARATLSYTTSQHEHLCDLVNQQGIKIKHKIKTQASPDGTLKVLDIIESET